METRNNIWRGIDFSGTKRNSAYHLLLPQAAELEAATAGVLTMEVGSLDAFSETESKQPVTIYSLHVVAPYLARFRRKILTVTEYRQNGIFPVDIFCHVDQHREYRVSEKEFLETITAILSRPAVANVVENLYDLSLQQKENNKTH